MSGSKAALEANPDATLAAALLVGARTEESHRDRLIAVLRRALERATTGEAKVRHGTELARIARLDPPDRVLAIDALRRVVAAAPGDAAAWRALADVALEQGATADAAAALESLAANARDPKSRLASLFDLAEIHRRRAGGAPDVERVLRAALDADPTSERAVRELLAARRAQAPQDEVTALLARLADAVQGTEAKATVLGELADAQRAAGDAAGAERSLLEAAALAPNAARLGRLLERYASSPAEQARVLGAAVARGRRSGTPIRPPSFASGGSRSRRSAAPPTASRTSVARSRSRPRCTTPAPSSRAAWWTQGRRGRRSRRSQG